MPLVSFAEAAALCGHRSRSTLYNLKKDGRLKDYLGVGPRGTPWLETHPAGREPLASYVLSVVRLQFKPSSQPDPPAQEPPRLPWAGYVREEGPEDLPLTHQEFWENVAALFDAGEGNFPPMMTWQQAQALWMELKDAVDTIAGGGRWDPEVWLRASFSDAEDPDQRAWVEGLLASGRLSADLEGQARQFLASAEAEVIGDPLL